jgi:hypothetical protein
LKDTVNIYDTCKATEINGYFCYSFVIEGTTHYVFGNTKMEAFDFMADYIKQYLKNGESKRG